MGWQTNVRGRETGAQQGVHGSGLKLVAAVRRTACSPNDAARPAVAPYHSNQLGRGQEPGEGPHG
jgi:hypothetical protein